MSSFRVGDVVTDKSKTWIFQVSGISDRTTDGPYKYVVIVYGKMQNHYPSGYQFTGQSLVGFKLYKSATKLPEWV